MRSRIFGPSRKEVTGWRILHNEEFCNFCSFQDVIKPRKIRGVCMREKRNAYKILVWKVEGNKAVGRHRNRWEIVLHENSMGRHSLDSYGSS
jgi:hypothetical protein